MAANLQNIRRAAMAGGLFLAAVLLCLPMGRRVASGVFAPFAALGHQLAELLSSLTPGSSHGGGSEKERLRMRVAELEAQLASVEALKQENRELRDVLELPPPAGWRAIAAAVVSRDPEQWNERLLINRGTADGVMTGATVLVGQNLLGRVIRCERRSAEVITILSEDCRFGVAITGTEMVGVLRGGGSRRFFGQPGFVVDFLPQDTFVGEGHRIVTSWLGGWMPDGVPVGEILADAPDGRRLHIADASRGVLHCRPFVSMRPFRFVTVLVPDHADEE